MIKRVIKNLARTLGIEITSLKQLEYWQTLQERKEDASELFDLILRMDFAAGPKRAQLYQDLIVLLATNFKREGFFVEFGATDGIHLNNTYLLETEYGWRGILAEPAKMWHDALLQNRTAQIDCACVWKTSNEILSFVEKAGFSTIEELSRKNQHAKIREKGVIYDVETISLEDLLKKHNAPRQIDYLSIDTEGSEFEILNSFDFSKYDISIITCEHNYTPDRDKIYQLLSANGFHRKFTSLSKWDDWYFKSNLQK